MKFGDKVEVEGSLGDRFIADLEAEVVDEEQQCLQLRVGAVFEEGKVVGHGLWLTYQEDHMGSPLMGPMLISKEVWDALTEHVREQWKDGNHT